MVITTSEGFEAHKLGKSIQKTPYLVVAPKTTPSYFPDTRRCRMFDSDTKYLNRKKRVSIVQYPDGSQKLIDYSIEYTPPEGYAEISDFMSFHLQKLEDFFVI
jgi:hypothetical protein